MFSKFDSATAISTPKYEKEIKREEFFSRWDKPFNCEHHTYHIFWLGTVHLFALYYSYLDFFTNQIARSTIPFEVLYGYIGGLGITVGCHRYWAHRSFKANRPLQIMLMIMQTISFQLPIHKWCLDHRLHHKYTDTDADPHNSKRGFLYCHVLWQCSQRPKECEEKRKTIDMSDLENDPVVRFQSKWYVTLLAIFFYTIPISVLYFVYELPLLYCIAANYRRYAVCLQFTWCVNSVAHMWGDKPYAKNMSAVENGIISLITGGEGWHNWHHTFPYDYKASEFGWRINLSTMFIDFFAWIGWAYDLKSVSPKILNARLQRTRNNAAVVGSTISSLSCDFEVKSKKLM